MQVLPKNQPDFLHVVTGANKWLRITAEEECEELFYDPSKKPRKLSKRKSGMEGNM